MEKIDQILESLYDRVIEPMEAKPQLLDLFGVSGCFTIGAKIQITHCIHGHGYEIGEVVTIIDHEPDEQTSWLCESKNGQWYICEDEGFPVNNR